MFELLKLNRGGSAYLSPKQIINGRVNLMDARKSLTTQDFALVMRVFDEISKYKEKRFLQNFTAYAEMAMQIIAHFDILVPYYLISGDAIFRNTANAIKEQEKEDYRKKAREHLATHLYQYTGDATWDKLVKDFYVEFLQL